MNNLFFYLKREGNFGSQGYLIKTLGHRKWQNCRSQVVRFSNRETPTSPWPSEDSTNLHMLGR